MQIGLISDTHGYLDPKISEYFNNCDEIWHAGDIGSQEVLNCLQAFKPTFAVYGNIDGAALRQQCPEDLWLQREGLEIFMTHIAGNPKRYDRRVKSIIGEKAPDILICGHSHLLKVMKDPHFNNMLYINPGAAGRHGFHRVKTVMRLTLDQGKISNLEVIELGKRGAIDR